MIGSTSVCAFPRLRRPDYVQFAGVQSVGDKQLGRIFFWTHITEMVGNFAAHLTRDEMAYGAQERGLNWGSIRALDELVDEGHLNDRGFWVEVPHPELDRSFKYPGPAGIYNGSPWRISRRAPLIGEHNEEIYCGELGLQRTELAYLAESGVV